MKLYTGIQFPHRLSTFPTSIVLFLVLSALKQCGHAQGRLCLHSSAEWGTITGKATCFHRSFKVSRHLLRTVLHGVYFMRQKKNVVMIHVFIAVSMVASVLLTCKPQLKFNSATNFFFMPNSLNQSYFSLWAQTFSSPRATVFINGSCEKQT